jgi:hypothetical protein
MRIEPVFPKLATVLFQLRMRIDEAGAEQKPGTGGCLAVCDKEVAKRPESAAISATSWGRSRAGRQNIDDKNPNRG